MSKFILVHEAPSGNPVVLHSEEVRVVSKSEVYEGASAIHSYVYEKDIANPYIHVVETPERIHELLNS